MVFSFTNKLCTHVPDVSHLSLCMWVVTCLIDHASVYVGGMWDMPGLSVCFLLFVFPRPVSLKDPVEITIVSCLC